MIHDPWKGQDDRYVETKREGYMTLWQIMQAVCFCRRNQPDTIVIALVDDPELTWSPIIH